MTRRNLSQDVLEDQRRREGADDLDSALARRLPPGVLLENVAFKASERRVVRHGLGARPRGVFASVPRGSAAFLVLVGSDSSGVTLENAANADATFDLWVYR